MRKFKKIIFLEGLWCTIMMQFVNAKLQKIPLMLTTLMHFCVMLYAVTMQLLGSFVPVSHLFVFGKVVRHLGLHT